MKYCSTCGASMPDEDIVCTNCGAAVNQVAVQKEPARKVVGVWGYIWRNLIMYIPVVGQILYLVFLFIAAFGSKDKEESFRNWAKSQLLVMAIILGIAVLVGLIMLVFFILGGVSAREALSYTTNDAVAGGIVY
ncbi:MAG: zinc ribbon domain-containing protein [Clostridia bacterium]|nr:zinc ribbon domain-containing protein [Clostridia bacterium]